MNIGSAICTRLANDCKDSFKGRAALNNRILVGIADIIDVLAAHIGELPINNLELINSFFSNFSRILEQTDNNNNNIINNSSNLNYH